MDIRPIRTEEDYKAALREVSDYFYSEPAPDTPDGDRFEILNRKRPLTLNMIWNLHQKLGIPADCLIQPPKIKVLA